MVNNELNMCTAVTSIDLNEETMEPEPKKLRTKEEKITDHLSATHILNGSNDVNSLLGKWRAGNFTPTTSEESGEVLRMAYFNLKKECDTKDIHIQDLQTKLNSAQALVKQQSEQIKALQAKLASQSETQLQVAHHIVTQPHQQPQQLLVASTPPKLEPTDSDRAAAAAAISDLKIIAPPVPVMGHVELRLIQQPPSQAVYQRILRPFPTVSIVGAHPKEAANFFVEVVMLKKSTFDDTNELQHVAVKSNGNSNAAEKEKNMIGGQLVQRCEPGSNAGNMLVVFRKLKILTTSSQQGGFFVLRFVLKRYTNDNAFEAVPNVNPVVSNPIEVFSHTLYLKGRPPSKAGSKGQRPPSPPDSADAALLASIINQEMIEVEVAPLGVHIKQEVVQAPSPQFITTQSTQTLSPKGQEQQPTV